MGGQVHMILILYLNYLYKNFASLPPAQVPLLFYQSLSQLSHLYFLIIFSYLPYYDHVQKLILLSRDPIAQKVPYNYLRNTFLRLSKRRQYIVYLSIVLFEMQMSQQSHDSLRRVRIDIFYQYDHNI